VNWASDNDEDKPPPTVHKTLKNGIVPCHNIHGYLGAPGVLEEGRRRVYTGGGPTSGGGAPASAVVREEGLTPCGEGTTAAAEGRRRLE
jgi:hypothetical protein